VENFGGIGTYFLNSRKYTAIYFACVFKKGLLTTVGETQIHTNITADFWLKHLSLIAAI
jgi:hypothetical protein